MSFNTFIRTEAFDNLSIKETTKRDYINKLKAVEKLIELNEGEIPEENLMEDLDVIIELITEKYPNKNTRTNYFSAIIKYIEVNKMNTPKYEEEFKVLKDLNRQLIQDFQNEEKVEPEKVKNVKNEYDRIKNSVIKLALEKELKDYKNSKKKMTDFLIYAFILSFPRRLEDINNLYFTKTLKKAEEDTNKNYVVVGRNQINLIFNHYKTEHAYGKQRFKIEDDKLKTILIKLTNQLSIGDKVFSKGTTASLNNLIKKFSLEWFGEKLTINDIRKLHSSTKFADITKEIEQDAKQMGHSVGTKLKWYIF